MPEGSRKLPWFPFFPADWLTDAKIMMLSDAAYRAYHTLLCQQWIEGELPDNPDQMATLSGAGSKWNEISSEVLPFFSAKKNGTLANMRLEAIRKEQEKRHKAFSDGGKRGATARWGGHKPGYKQANGLAYGNQNQREKEEERDTALGENYSGLAGYFGQRYEAEFNQPYVLNQKRDFNAFAKLNGNLPVEEIKRRIDALFDTWSENWRSRDGQLPTPATLAQCINELPTAPAKPPPGPMYVDWSVERKEKDIEVRKALGDET